jgi:hypothetical protein
MEQELHRLRGLLYVALNCLYLQSNDNLVMSLGQYRLVYADFKAVLSPKDVYGCWVRGYMAQGQAQEPPCPEDGLSPEASLEQEHCAALVQTDWVFAHMFLRPSIGGWNHGEPNFEEAVKLVWRATETLCQISFKISQAALALAALLGIEERVLEADLAAEARLEPPDSRPFAPRLPSDFARWLDPSMSWLTVPPMEKSPARLAWEAQVLEVFSFYVCRADDRWDHTADIMLCATGLRKRYSEMTPQERISSGCIHLRHTMAALKQKHTLEEAIMGSLMGARALERAARKLFHAHMQYAHATQ